MEEDIMILESECYYLEELGYLRENNHFIRFNQALENLIKAYKEQKEYLEVTSKALDNIAYDQIPIAIKELEENISKEHTLGYSQGVYDCSEAWKETIKEKIEELKERLIYYQNLKVPEVDDNGVRTGLIVDETIMILKAKTQVLEELLGEEK